MSDPILQGGEFYSEAIEPRESIGFLLRCAQQVHTRCWVREFGADLTSSQYVILAAVSRWPGIDQTRAGEVASLDKSNAADVINRLAEVGWLFRDQDMGDHRKRVLRLTVPAREALKSITPRVKNVQRELISQLPAEEATEFIRLLARVAYRSSDDLAPEPPEADAEVIGISTSPGHLLRRAMQVHTALWGTFVGAEMTGPQYGVVSTLARHGEMDQKQLGELASLDKSVVGDVVLRLSRKGVLAKGRDPADGRRRLLHVTEAGFSLLHRTTPGVAHVQETLLSPLSQDESHELTQMLARVCGVVHVENPL